MISVIDCGGANLQSVTYAIDKLKIEYKICKTKKDIKNSKAILLPGVGAAKNVMNNLKKQDLVESIKNYSNPILGICVGMQIFYEFSEEEDTECLGILPGTIKKFVNSDLTIPHMGWNKVVFEDSYFIDCSGYYYFANSYYAEISKSTFAKTKYGTKFSSCVNKDNFYGVQFHPEKSSVNGMRFLKSFFSML